MKFRKQYSSPIFDFLGTPTITYVSLMSWPTTVIREGRIARLMRNTHYIEIGFNVKFAKVFKNSIRIHHSEHNNNYFKKGEISTFYSYIVHSHTHVHITHKIQNNTCIHFIHRGCNQVAVTN